MPAAAAAAAATAAASAFLAFCRAFFLAFLLWLLLPLLVELVGAAAGRRGGGWGAVGTSICHLRGSSVSSSITFSGLKSVWMICSCLFDQSNSKPHKGGQG
jgi:hypothetical protein